MFVVSHSSDEQSIFCVSELRKDLDVVEWDYWEVSVFILYVRKFSVLSSFCSLHLTNSQTVCYTSSFFHCQVAISRECEELRPCQDKLHKSLILLRCWAPVKPTPP